MGERNMQLKVKLLTCVAIISASLVSTPVVADQSISCKSRNHEYKMCRIDTHGYVRLVKEHSRSHCVQGRTWDYDQRGNETSFNEKTAGCNGCVHIAAIG